MQQLCHYKRSSSTHPCFLPSVLTHRCMLCSLLCRHLKTSLTSCSSAAWHEVLWRSCRETCSQFLLFKPQQYLTSFSGEQSVGEKARLWIEKMFKKSQSLWKHKYSITAAPEHTVIIRGFWSLFQWLQYKQETASPLDRVGLSNSWQQWWKWKQLQAKSPNQEEKPSCQVFISMSW